MKADDLISSEAWKVVYEECWSRWKIGLDRLRKASNGIEAASAKQQMDEAESMLKLPLRDKKMDGENKANYERRTMRDEERMMKEKFHSGVEEGGV